MTDRAAAAGKDFGLVVGGILAAMGGWFLYRAKHGAVAPALLGVGVLLVLLALVAPKALDLPSRAWMALAEGMSFVMTRLILFIVFVLVVTPIGLFRRLTGADPLRRRTSPAGSSWYPYPKRHLDPKHYEKSF